MALADRAMASGLELIRPGESKPVRVDALASELAKNNSSTRLSLRSALRGTKLVFPAPTPHTTPDPAVATRREMLARRAEHREYATLVSSVHRAPVRPEERVGASLRHQYTIGANMVVAPVASSFICYILSKSLVEKATSRVVAGLMGGIVMLFVEMILYIARAYMVDHQADRRKRRKPSGQFGGPS